MVQFNHPRLGSIEYVEKERVSLFYGLKYASLEHPFAAPELYSAKVDNVTATQHGPTAISPPIGCDMELGLIQKNLPHDVFESSATECLNLNVCLPKDSKGPLPVFVFIHGGGFAIGSNAWPQYDLACIVNYSEEIGKPVIGVQINYRLGIYGLLDSKTLRDIGVVPNRSLHDQRAAFQWIQDNITGFGGDPERVTAIGQSAGAVSITMLLQSPEPLFKQLVAMGGTSILMKPLPPFVAEAAYRVVLQKLDIDPSLAPAEQLRRVIETPAFRVLTSIGPDIPLLPVTDDDLLQLAPTFSTWSAPDRADKLPGTKWCARVMLGDCRFDGSILNFALAGRKAGIAAAFQSSLSNTLKGHEKELKTIFNSYKITFDVSDDEALKNILRYITDVHFYAPVIELAKSWPQSAFVYHFNEPNPWEGPSKGEASHILDVAFLLQNFNDHLSAKQQSSAKRFAKDIITFVNGEEPYPIHDQQTGGAEVYGPPADAGVKFVQSENVGDYGRRGLIWDLSSSVGLDKLSEALDIFMANI